MTKKISIGKSKGKSLYGSNKSHVSFESNSFFIGIVDHVVTKGSEDLQPQEGAEFMDNRNVVYVYPIDSNDLTIKKCYTMNSHEVDMPITGEPVLVCKTNVGNIVIDRFSPHAFGVNYELGDYLLRNVGDGNIRVEIDDETKKRLGIETVKPFFSKEGSKAFFGRNNQYMIFDYGSRIESESEENEYTSEGSFIRLGIKDSEKQHSSKSDRSQIIVGVNAKVQTAIETNIESQFNPDVEDEPNNGIGFQSDELVFVGRQFVVLYSQVDMLLTGGRNLYVDFEKIIQKAENIKIGSEKADQPTVLGNKLVDMMEDLVEIMLSQTHLHPQGPTTGLNPTSQNKLRRFKSKYLKKNKSPIHSRKIFNE